MSYFFFLNFRFTWRILFVFVLQNLVNRSIESIWQKYETTQSVSYVMLCKTIKETKTHLQSWARASTVATIWHRFMANTPLNNVTKFFFGIKRTIIFCILACHRSSHWLSFCCVVATKLSTRPAPDLQPYSAQASHPFLPSVPYTPPHTQTQLGSVSSPWVCECV